MTKSKTQPKTAKKKTYRRKKKTFAIKTLESEAHPKGPEMKDLTFAFGSQIAPAQTTASQIFLVNDVNDILHAPLGSVASSQSRIGRVISCKYLDYDWMVMAAGLNYPARIQAKVYWQKENPSGGTPSATDFQVTDELNGMRNLDQIDNFTCLATIEPVPVVTGYGAGGAWNGTYRAAGRVNLHNAVSRFNNFTSGISSMESGLLWIVTYGTSDIVSVAAYSKFQIRFRFTDA